MLGINYGEVRIENAYRLDLLVEEKLIVELKSVNELNELHFAQLLTYLRLSKKRLGLLFNFNEVLLKDGIMRVINNQFIWLNLYDKLFVMSYEII